MPPACRWRCTIWELWLVIWATMTRPASNREVAGAGFRIVRFRRRQALALRMLGDHAYCKGDYVRSNELLEQNLEIIQSATSDPSFAYESYFLARTRCQFDRRAGRALLEQCLDAFRSAEDRLGAAYVSVELGRQVLQDGDASGAASLFKEALIHSQELGSAHLFLMCVEGFAHLAAVPGALAGCGASFRCFRSWPARAWPSPSRQ